MSTQDFDVVIVGASLAGCTAATLLGRAGLRVAVVERHLRPDSHKALCTHFIQPSALPVMQRLGLDRLIEEAGGVRNPIELHTPAGWIGCQLGDQEDGSPRHGYNIRRSRLDPMMRELAAGTPGVTMLLGVSAKGLVEREGRVAGIELGGSKGEGSLTARLVVAADGRQSALAAMAGAKTQSSPNVRFGVMAPMRNVDLQRGRVSQMWLTGPDAAYVFPNDDGVTIVAWMGLKDELERVRERPLESLLKRIRALPDAPRLQQFQLAGDVLTIKDFPSLWRPPVVRGMALVGDAMMSLDYLQGVGCGWALQGGAWLCDALAADLKAGADLAAGLKRYERACAALAGHRFTINDFARNKKLNPIQRLMFAAAAKDPGIALHVNRFGARLDGLPTFLAPGALLDAAWVNLTRPALPQGTRQVAAQR